MPQEFNNLTFIEHAKLVHGERYDYSAVAYRGIDAEVCVICRMHGGFFLTANQHLNGRGCPACSLAEFVKPRE